MKYTVEEVREWAITAQAQAKVYASMKGSHERWEKLEAILTAYAERIEADERAVLGGRRCPACVVCGDDMVPNRPSTAPPASPAGVPDGWASAVSDALAVIKDAAQFHGELPVGIYRQIQPRLTALLAAQGQGDIDGMCNEDHPERRCICREEFGHRVCGTTPPASPARVPDGLVEVSALRNLIRGNGGWASCFNDESFVMWKDIERLIAAPSAPEGDGGAE